MPQNVFEQLVAQPGPAPDEEEKVKLPTEDSPQHHLEVMGKFMGRYAPAAAAAALGPGGAGIWGGLAKLAQFGAMAGMEALLPSESPSTELGAVLGSAIGGKYGKAGSLLTKIGAEMLGVGAGASAGEVFNNIALKPDQVFEFDIGKVAMYVGMSPIAAAAGHGIQKKIAGGRAIKNEMITDVNKFEQATSEKMPFTVGQAIRGETGQTKTGGILGMMEEHIFTNSPAQQKAASAQSSAAKKGLSKMFGLPEDDLLRTNDFANNFFPEFKAKVQALPFKARKVLDDISSKKISAEDAIGKIRDAEFELGTNLLPDNMVKDLVKLEQMELSALDSLNKMKEVAGTVGKNSDAFLTFFAPSNESMFKNLDKLETLMEVATPQDKQRIGGAIVQRILANNKAIAPDGQIAGIPFGKAIKDMGYDRLKTLFGSDSAEALESLGRIMTAFDPAETISNPTRRITEQSRTGVYTARKLFLVAIAGGATGGAVGGVPGAVAGAAGFATIAIPLSAAINGALKNGRPYVNLLEAAMNGNPNAANNLMRLTVLGKLTDSPAGDYRSEQPARSRLRGLLGLGVE